MSALARTHEAPLSAIGLQRSARLMRALGPDAAPVWAELAPQEVRTLTEAINALPADDTRADAEAVQQFVDAHRRLAPSPGTSIWTALSGLDADQLASLFAGEHPQMLAFSLSRLPGDAAARLVRALEPQLAVEAMHRLLHLAHIHPGALQALEREIETRLSLLSGDGLRSGHERVARIFDQLDSRAGQRLFAGLEDAEPGASEKVRALMFTFDDLAHLDAGGLQTLLAAADRNGLLLALKGAAETTSAAFFANMTQRAGDLLREEIAALGPVRRSEVDAARAEIIQLARALIHRGEIRAGRDAIDEELVD